MCILAALYCAHPRLPPRSIMTKSFKEALSRSSSVIPGVRDAKVFKSGNGHKPAGPVNPFNLKVTRSKFEVLGRNQAGVRGNTLQSRTRAVAVRQATIVPQLKEQGRAHVSSFVDKRFGARDVRQGTLSREDVMQERFAREQQRQARKKLRRQKFDLNDGLPAEDVEDDGKHLSLTHGGQKISQMADEDLEYFDEDELGGADEEAEQESFMKKRGIGQLGRDLVSAAHFGGGDFGSATDSAPKSKQEVMKELIARSKYFKAERQKIKEENEEMCEDLNEAFAAIRKNLRVLTDEDRQKLRKPVEPAAAADVASDEDEYEAMLKELAFDPRAKPTDRTLTVEERERRDKEQGEEQQKALLKRMSPDVEEFGVEEDGLGKKKKKHQDADSDEDVADVDDSAMPADPELYKIAQKQAALMKQFCQSGSLSAANCSYKELAEFARKQPRTMIHLSRAIRGELSQSSTKFTEASNATGRGGLMPPMRPVKLLLLVSRLFSCSDFHHVVSTPSHLLLSYYLKVGRMTSLKHVQRALALIFVAGEFESVANRYIPEVFEVLFTLLNAIYMTDAPSSSQSCSQSKLQAASHYFCRPIGKKLTTLLRDGRSKVTSIKVDSERLFFASTEGMTGEELVSCTLGLLQRMTNQLAAGKFLALKEVVGPFAMLLRGRREAFELVEVFDHMLSDSRDALKLQQHKPLAIPLLTPDFTTNYNMDSARRIRRRDGENNGEVVDEQAASRMRRALKREFKGAARELKRDASFLAEHKLKERRAKDSEYRAKINRIIGSISNESGFSRKK